MSIDAGQEGKDWDADNVSVSNDNKDKFIVFLDAASDSNFKVLQETFDMIDDIFIRTNILRFQDTDKNTALHFGARNGNYKICNFIIE